MNALSEYKMLADYPDMGVTIPNRVFFKPLPTFPDFIKQHYPGMPVVDVGAGVGRMSRVLASAGIKVLAIDIFTRDNPEFHVHVMDATSMLFPPMALPILARPCHGLFVEAVITHILNQVPVMLYIGLERNFEIDLEGLPFDWRVTPDVVGEEGEKVVVIKPL